MTFILKVLFHGLLEPKMKAEENKILARELARATVMEYGVASTAAIECKDECDQVTTVKQQL
ncbi:hypothetical protein C5167_041842 [Papaver somniferum]|nr:hypothetical protein C5167_041842 [Papaver somniferum]